MHRIITNCSIPILLVAMVVRLSWVARLADWSMPNIPQLASIYHGSQYCLTGLRDQFSLDSLLPELSASCGDGAEFLGNIDDPELYVLAGSQYVGGSSPTSINWELSPLTKYLFGAAMALGVSPLVVQWLMLLILVTVVYKISRELGLSPTLSLLAPTLLVYDGLILEQLTHTYLDLTQATLILLALLLLGRSLKSRSSFAAFGIVLGLVAASKSFSMGIVLGAAAAFAVLISNKSRFFEYLRSLAISALVYLVIYSQFFVTHGIFNLDFVNLHITILKFYKSYVPEYPWGEIWRVLTLGQWRTWWGDKGLIGVPEWSILWPVGLVAAGLVAFAGRLRNNPLLLALLLWTIIYLLFASVRLVFPRYLLPILPVLYLSSGIMLSCLSNLFSSTSKATSTWIA